MSAFLKKFALCGLIILGLAAQSAPVQALIDESRYTEEEKVAFAFHKLGRIPPDFEAWIKSADEYQVGSPHQRLDMLKSGFQRLEVSPLHRPGFDLARQSSARFGIAHVGILQDGGD